MEMILRVSVSNLDEVHSSRGEVAGVHIHFGVACQKRVDGIAGAAANLHPNSHG